MAHENMAQLAINTVRTLSIDAVQAAKSGHPGTPMALAPVGAENLIEGTHGRSDDVKTGGRGKR